MKRLRLLHYLVTLSVFMAANVRISHAQVNVTSPSATELVRHERIPVGYFNGLPAIDIPLYTIQSKDIVFPISLSYHASGIKVNQYPTMVGLGWNMNLGAITRVVNGIPDETCGNDIEDQKVQSFEGMTDTGFYFSSQFMDGDDWASKERLEDHYISSDVLEYDIEPDEFVINAYGLSGSIFFYRDSNGTIHSRIKTNNGETFKVESHIMTDNPTSIVFSENESDIPLRSYRIYKMFKEFTIIKNDGTRLVFGGDDDHIEFHTEKRVSENNRAYMKTWPSAWMLKEIISPKGNRLSFQYRRHGSPVIMSDVRTDIMTIDYVSGDITENRSTDPSRGLSFIIQHPLYPLSISSNDGLSISFSTTKANDLPTITEDGKRFLNMSGFDHGQNSELIDNIYYSKGTTVNPTAVFAEPYDYSQRLTAIDIYHKQALIKSLKFRYIENQAERLKLDMLNIGNATGNHEQIYHFEYDGGKLPQYNSTVTDNWGYWNNKNYRNADIDENFFGFRSPAIAYTKAETLTKITWPTGGYVTFDYELNDYSKVATQAPDFDIIEMAGQAGGLRIKQIKHCTDTTEYVHSFEYKNLDGTSSGILSGIPVYQATGKHHANFEYTSWLGLVYMSYKIDIDQLYQMESEAYINTLGLTTGNHVTYSRVIESIGKTSPLRKEYIYTNHDSHPDTADFSMYTNIDNVALDNKFTSRELMRGLLTNEVWYNGDVKVKEIKNRYKDGGTEEGEYMKAIDLFSNPGQNKNSIYFPFVRYAPYKILTFYPYLTSRIEDTYDPTGTVVISSLEEQYIYDDNLLLKKKIRKDSKGQWETTSVSYPDEYTSGIYTVMKDRNMVSCPVETTTSKNGKIIGSSLNEYKEEHSNILPGKTWKLNVSESIDSAEFIPYSANRKDSHYILDNEIIDYDKYGNPLHVCDNQGIHTSYKWGYGATYPTTMIVGASNTYETTTVYTPQIKSERISLDPSYTGTSPRNYTFTTHGTGDVTISLGGALGYDWLVNGTLDTKGFTLVQQRSGLPQEEPWNRYAAAYTYSVTFTSVPAGQHTLSVESTSVRSGDHATGEHGGLTCTYQGAVAHVEEEGFDEFLYEDFEGRQGNGIYPFGYHSDACRVGTYEVVLKGDSDRKYILDYRVYKEGKWEYVRTSLSDRCHIIDEGVNPIDAVRVYPADADIQTFSWIPHVGMRSRSNSAGITESYAFDRFGRLEGVKDNNGDVIRQYRYNYVSSSLSAMPSEYYNDPISMIFYSSACDKNLGNLPVPVDYTIPAHKHLSTISQSDANRLAFDDLISNGQAYADTHGTCEPHVVVSVYNASRSPMTIQCAWRENGIIQEILFPIPQSDQVGTSGIINEDYLPQTIYLPRENYLYVKILNEDMQEIPFISESGHNCGFMYSEEDFPEYSDTYIIR